MGVRFGFAIRVLFAVLLDVIVPAAFAQGNPANGKTLFEGNSIQPCTACHFNVDNRRMAIDPNGDLDFDLVLAHFLNAIAAQSVMNKFSALSGQQKNDIAAYIADVPKARPNLVDFTAANTSIETSPVTIAFANAVTATSALTIVSVGIGGTNNADFTIKPSANPCATSMSLGAGVSCTVNVAFRTQTSTPKTALLDIGYSQAGANTLRTAQLNGTVAGQNPPPSAAMPGGGGALPAGGIGLLLLALGLRRRT